MRDAEGGENQKMDAEVAQFSRRVFPGARVLIGNGVHSTTAAWLETPIFSVDEPKNIVIAQGSVLRSDLGASSSGTIVASFRTKFTSDCVLVLLDDSRLVWTWSEWVSML